MPRWDNLRFLTPDVCRHQRFLLSIRSGNSVKHDPLNLEAIRTIGTRVAVEWREDDELLDWKPGWYLATVRMYNHQKDMVTLEYVTESAKEYTMPVET